jgi:lipopolysaccharide transport system permease protein
VALSVRMKWSMGITEQQRSKASPSEPVVDPQIETARHEESESVWKTLGAGIREVVQYRELLFQLTLRDVRIRYKQAVMGFGWALVMPVLVVGAGFLIKIAMAQMSGSEFRAESFAGMAVKALPWTFFVGAIGSATGSLTGNSNLLTKIYFPREVLPGSAVLAQAFDSAIGTIVLSLVLLFFLRIGLSLQTLWLVPLMALFFLFTTGAALVLSCANLFFRDVKYIVQVFVTFGIFFTPVLYEPENFGPAGCRVMMLNPLAPLLEGIRLATIEHHNLVHSLVVKSAGGAPILAWHPLYLLYAGSWTLLGSVGAWVLFRRLQFVYAEYI